jgi:hypothetical protein
VNALVKQGNALPTVGYLAPPDLVYRWDERSAEALLSRGVVGATGSNL